MNQNEEKIFLAISSYCDPELLNTINSALIQAEYKDRIHLGICYQSDDIDELNKLKQLKNCEVIHIAKKDARGSVYARYLCQKLIKDEEYVLQIDSHMRFVKYWDTKIINQLNSLNDKKAIITVYPPSCNNELIKLALDDKKFDEPALGAYMCADKFKDENSYLLDMRSELINKDDKKAYKKNPFLSGNYFFTYGKAYKEVFFDPKMFFYGDELPMAIRFYTHGWNMYSPGECYAYHRYGRDSRSFPMAPEGINENERFKDLLNINGENKDLGIFGFGKVRTLKEYEDFSGVHFKDRIIYMNAETGEIDNPNMIGKLSYFKQKEIDEKKLLTQNEPIDVIIIDPYNEYKKCINSCFMKSSFPDTINFLIATTDPNYKKENICSLKNIKKVIKMKDKSEYVKCLSKLVKQLGKDYVMIVDSSFRFAYGWDKYYRDNIKLCGDSSILTSWIYETDENKENKIYKYVNIVKELNEFNNLLPSLRFNESIKLSTLKNPYQTAFISDGFVFCKSNILKKVPIDPSLTFEEHQFIYSLRLWTNGINIYYPTYTFFVRIKSKTELYGGTINRSVVSAISGIYNHDSKRFNSNYKYDNGNVRPLWTWYEYIHANYDRTRHAIEKEDKI